jgi:hypothetical protein
MTPSWARIAEEEEETLLVMPSTSEPRNSMGCDTDTDTPEDSELPAIEPAYSVYWVMCGRA